MPNTVKLILTFAFTLMTSIGAFAQTGDTTPCPITCPDDSTTCYSIHWQYVRGSQPSEDDDAYRMEKDGTVFATRLNPEYRNLPPFDSTDAVHGKYWRQIFKVDPEVYCIMADLVRQSIPRVDVLQEEPTGNYTIIMSASDRKGGPLYFANWSRTERSDEASAYLRVYLRLINIVPPTALDEQK